MRVCGFVFMFASFCGIVDVPDCVVTNSQPSVCDVLCVGVLDKYMHLTHLCVCVCVSVCVRLSPLNVNAYVHLHVYVYISRMYSRSL